MSRRKKNDTRDVTAERYASRSLAVLGLFAVGVVMLVARAVDLQVLKGEFLTEQGEVRHLRSVPVPAHRGPILDRHGQPLAVSTPVDRVTANPQLLVTALDRVDPLADRLGVDREWLERRIAGNTDREWVSLKRQLQPDQAARIMALGLPGVDTEREYRRYYPAGEVTGHLLGFTDIDDEGQEGLEKAYDDWLRGRPGLKRVIRDNTGRVIEDVELMRAAQPGRALRTSIDLTIQYLAYRELKAAVAEHRARAGSIVVLDVDTGEVLAMVNQPAYNPNEWSQREPARYRNRAATDMFEPGSSFKPFVVAAALESGRYGTDARIDTGKGFFQVGNKTIQDKNPLGVITLDTLLARSSNVGAAKLAMTLEPAFLFETLDRFGIGRLTGSGFPAESRGIMNPPHLWRPIAQATIAYGYGLSVTALQLAQAYAVIGADGLYRPVSLLALDEPPPGHRAVSPDTARAVLGMLETVTGPAGTGQRAAIPGYRVAGKTGTAWKSSGGGYATDRYLAIFGGVAPASDPKLATVVVIDEPAGGAYYGGDVAAPVYARVTADALRLLAIAPDAPLEPREPVIARAEAKP